MASYISPSHEVREQGFAHLEHTINRLVQVGRLVIGGDMPPDDTAGGEFATLLPDEIPPHLGNVALRVPETETLAVN